MYWAMMIACVCSMRVKSWWPTGLSSMSRVGLAVILKRSSFTFLYRARSPSRLLSSPFLTLDELMRIGSLRRGLSPAVEEL